MPVPGAPETPHKHVEDVEDEKSPCSLGADLRQLVHGGSHRGFASAFAQNSEFPIESNFTKLSTKEGISELYPQGGINFG
jgi:hypothetical protein